MGDVVSMQAADLRRLILESQDIRREAVSVPQWGVTLWVRGMTGRERDEYEESMLEGRGKKQKFRWNAARARLVAMCATDEQGNRVFTDEDVPRLNQKSAAALDLLWDRIRELSGLTTEDEKELEGEEDRPNPSTSPSSASGSVPSGDSGSA